MACLTSLIVSTAHAEVVATQIVEKEIVQTGANGAINVARVSAEKVSPGEEVIYTLNFENRDDRAAEDIVLVMPVPAEIIYLEGSIVGDGATASFSADGGQTYLNRGRLTVIENGAVRPARGNEITHIKWTLTQALAPRATGVVSYRGILK